MVSNLDLAAVIKTHSALVGKIARHLGSKLPCCIEHDDLVQSGMIGLMAAASQYVLNDGPANFMTYAMPRIKGAMIDEVRSQDWISRTSRDKARKIERATRDLEHSLGRRTSPSEVADKMNISLQDHYNDLNDAYGVGIVYKNHSNDEDEQVDFLADPCPNPEDAASQSQFSQALAEQISSLPDREKMAISLMYEDSLSVKDTAVVMKISEGRVCQLRTKAVERLRESMKLQSWTSAPSSLLN